MATHSEELVLNKSHKADQSASCGSQSRPVSSATKVLVEASSSARASWHKSNQDAKPRFDLAGLAG